MAKPVKPPEKESRKPDLIARCRQSPGSEYFQTVGVAWETEVGGERAYSVKLNVLPVQFDGSFLLLVPKDRDE